MRTGPPILDLCLSELHRYVYVGETLGWRVYVEPHGLLRPEVFFCVLFVVITYSYTHSIMYVLLLIRPDCDYITKYLLTIF